MLIVSYFYLSIVNHYNNYNNKENAKEATSLQSCRETNHLMYMVNIKTSVKNKNGLEALLQTIRIYNQDIGIEFGIKKCDMLIMTKRKREIMEGIELLKSGKYQNT